jgi:xanthine dehydrogenase accessory factor
MYDEFFTKAHELTRAGVPFATATVVRAERPSSGKPGDRAIILPNGVMHGWIGGSCAQPTVVKEALAALAADESRLIRLSTDTESRTTRPGLIDMPMTCFSGGTLEIFIEAHHPRPRLLIVGELPVAQSLAHLGKAMNYHVIAVDPDGAGGMDHADEVLHSLDEIAIQLLPNTYAVVATHGNYDELALEMLLRARPSYVALVASRRRAQAVRDYLAEHGVSETDLLRLRAPAGLDIQARRGDEIALSIMAEIVQTRRNSELLDLALFQQPAETPEDVHEHEAHANAPIVLEMAVVETAIDPVCHMTVEIRTARFMSEYEGGVVYFCCAGCKSRFDKEPAAYLHGMAG